MTQNTRARVAELEAVVASRDEDIVGYVRTIEDTSKQQDEAEARVAELEAMLKECADDLECEVEGRYDRIKDHPAMTPRYERDMDIVIRARAVLAKMKA